jgi:hypothetical protein
MPLSRRVGEPCPPSGSGAHLDVVEELFVVLVGVKFGIFKIDALAPGTNDLPIMSVRAKACE